MENFANEQLNLEVRGNVGTGGKITHKDGYITYEDNGADGLNPNKPPRATAGYLGTTGMLLDEELYKKIHPNEPEGYKEWQDTMLENYNKEKIKFIKDNPYGTFDSYQLWSNNNYETEGEKGFLGNLWSSIKDKSKDVTKEDIKKGGEDIKDFWNWGKGLFGKDPKDNTTTIKKDPKDKGGKKGISPLMIGGIVLVVLIGGTLAIYFATRNKGGALPSVPKATPKAIE